MKFLRCLLLLGAAASWLHATPVWKAPKELPLGELAVLELEDDDASKPTLPRPGDEKLGPLELRGVEPSASGRGWRLTVQAMIPGVALIPSMDMGDGRRAPELRIPVPRSVPYGAPWQGFGGGQGDILPYIPFPWTWASLLLLPFVALGWWFWTRWLQGSGKRTQQQAQRVFVHHWPPVSSTREALDTSHLAGRDLLAAHFGDEARSWGPVEFQAHRLDVWVTWVRSLDAARFSRKESPFPPLSALLKVLGGHS